LGDYSAVCSYEGGWIEAVVRPLALPQASSASRLIFGDNAARTNESVDLRIEGPERSLLQLTEKHGILYWLDYGAQLYLRIEGIGITEHDKAVNLLEDLSNSLFMQIDFRFDSPLTLGRDSFLLKGITSRPGRLDQDNQLMYPRFTYERGPSSLYWYARSAVSLPLLQFLALYQCIEFFFPQYSRREAISRIKNILKDPTFDGTKDSYVNVLLNATLEGYRGSLLEERKQLGATLKQCIDSSSIRDFLNDTAERIQFYSKEYREISDKKLSLTDETNIVEQTADRIYDIRCKIVHTKNLEGSKADDMILPFSKEADLLVDDVELIKFLARKVMIASGSPLKL